MSDNANLLDIAGNRRVGRFVPYIVDESAVVNASYPPLDTYRSNIVRVVKVDAGGHVLFNIDLDTARYAFNSNAEMIINLLHSVSSNTNTAILLTTHHHNLVDKFPARTLLCDHKLIKEL